MVLSEKKEKPEKNFQHLAKRSCAAGRISVGFEFLHVPPGPGLRNFALIYWRDALGQ
jgi:hypothetical protein